MARIYVRTSVNRGCASDIDWRKAVFKRDNYTCQWCGVLEKLVAHHIVSWNDSIELRFSLSNGVTLCAKCHLGHHKNSKWSKGATKIPWNKGLKTGVGGPKKGTKFTDEHKKKLSNAKVGTKISDDHKEKLRLAKTPENIKLNKLRLKGKSWKKCTETGKRIWYDK